MEVGHTPCQPTTLPLSLSFPIPLGSTINPRIALTAQLPSHPLLTPPLPLRWSQAPLRRLGLLTMSSEHRALNALCFSPRPACPQWSPGPLFLLSAAWGPQALELPHKPAAPSGPGSRLRPDQNGVPSGLVKDTASSPHTPPAASAIGWPTRRGTLTQTRSDPGSRTEQSKARRTVDCASRPQQLYSHPPTRLRLCREGTEGGTAATSANHEPQSRSGAPAPRSAFCQWEENERR